MRIFGELEGFDKEDPPSLMLFIPIMEALRKMIDRAILGVTRRVSMLFIHLFRGLLERFRGCS